MIPAFQFVPNYPHDILPDGVYPCNEAELKAAFVAAISNSSTREAIFRGFLQLRVEIAKFGVAATQWVDGSFVESKTNPVDVDVVSYCDSAALNGLGSPQVKDLLELVGGREMTKAAFQTHTFFVPVYPIGHSAHPLFERSRMYWRKWFGTTRELTRPFQTAAPGHSKGFVSMTLGTNAPMVSTSKV
jgi:hypothetical protein